MRVAVAFAAAHVLRGGPGAPQTVCPHRVVHLFHGTGRQNIESIIANGFLGSHARSGGKMIWFSRQSTYSFAFTASVPGKGLGAQGGRAGMAGMPGPAAAMRPSGVMFVCALLVAKRPSRTSNVGDAGQDVITMLDERACLPLYLIETKMGAHVAGWAGLVPPPQIFQGKGRRLGGGRKL